ncbi:hypothetical protein LINGRAHAP2_LOCUS3986 [Linum grandiflorum]
MKKRSSNFLNRRLALAFPHHSRLYQKTVETLMCTRTWQQEDLMRDIEVDASQLDGLFTLLDINDVAAEKKLKMKIMNKVMIFKFVPLRTSTDQLLCKLKNENALICYV